MSTASQLPDRVLSLLQGKKATPLNAATLSRRLRVPLRTLSLTLEQLEKTNRISRVRGDQWIASNSADLVTGTIQFHAKGFAF
ncbi:hypothetical protein EBY67_00500, partial [bacterium]|nr:hypothetical protein [bacterium]